MWVWSRIGICYSTSIYISYILDFRKHVFEIYNGDGKRVSTAFHPTGIWQEWNRFGCFTEEHWQFISQKHTLSGRFEKHPSGGMQYFPNKDDR